MAKKSTKTTTSKKIPKPSSDADNKSETASDSDNTNTSENEGATGYTLGERQKPVTDNYRTSWDRIFSTRRGKQ